MKRFFGADHHFNHGEIIARCGRPFADQTVMNRELVRLHNERVTKDDHVYFLGDFGRCTTMMCKYLLSEMHGVKFLIEGDHDREQWNKDQWKRMGFADVFTHLDVPVGGWKVRLRHKPVPLREIPDGVDYVVCGHLHNFQTAPPRNICVSLDLTDYAPLSQGELVERIKQCRTRHTFTVKRRVNR
jgi:calcineurin-like phosphoesterase family protein